MPLKRKRTRLNREQLSFELDGIMKAIEDSFIIKLTNFFIKKTNNLIKSIKDLPLFKKKLQSINPEEIKQLKTLMQKYYKAVGKAGVKQVNKEIKELSGQRSSIRIPDINEGLRYRSEEMAVKKLRDFNRQLREDVDASPGILKDKAELKRVIRKSGNTFLNRNVKIVARMESVTAVNEQRLEAFNKSTIVKGVQFLAVLDKRTTVICKSRHGHILKLNSPQLSRYKPPCHMGCRSLLSPVTIFEKDLDFTPLSELKKVPDKEFKKPVKLTSKDKVDLNEVNHQLPLT